MGGWHAFAGGGLSRQDADVPVRGQPQGLEGDPELGMPEALLVAEGALEENHVPGLVACALRELFEETGVLPGVTAREPAAALRRQLLNGEISFADAVTDLDRIPRADRLVFAGRWMTPPLAPLRFDNRFFLLHWPPSEAIQPTILPGELSSGEWIRPAAALEAWERGDVLTSPPILHILRVLQEEGPEAGLERLRNPQETLLGPVRKVEFRPGVILLPLRSWTLPPATHTNAFLLGRQEAVLVDPGSALEDQQAILESALEDARHRHGLTVRAIWLTHHHPDHVGGVEAARRQLGVPVAAHRLTAEKLAPHGLVVDEFLEDGQRVELAGERPFPVRVLHTPGHTRGHLCFYDETHGSLLAGDLVAGLGTIVIDPPEGNMEQYMGSLQRMIDLSPRTLFPAHGPALGDAVGHLQENLDHRRQREAAILEAWQAGHRQPAAIVDQVYEDLAPPIRPVAARQVLAHLERLRLQKRLD
jgi:glyoxylase-like metal-dependent hydrolase (beta-lactamase superfamily II)/8-oxo-dGTP pyrophosphatase MutT (NUDIX family)